MTYNELRDYIDKFDAAGMVNEPAIKALRAVVELHNPIKFTSDMGYDYLICEKCTKIADDYFKICVFPCSTIEAIEKELA